MEGHKFEVEDEQSTDKDDWPDFGQNPDDFKAALQECLDNVQHQGTFSSLETVDTYYINPGLLVKGIGTVGLPLPERDARAIAGVCKQSPFGKGDETVIDETVRKTWELNTTEFECRNPNWNTYLHMLADKAVENLGVQVKASAQPYKLLLYEKGAFFKAHRDTEKVPGMFGTLVVCLPSEHTGGEVLLVHGKEQRTLETATASAFGLSALAWYSDVQHEIKPVTSGYRLVLTYNLVQDQTLPKQTAAALNAGYKKLDKLLDTWSSQFEHLDFLVYPLEHQYTGASLSLRNLKGQDAAKGRYLEQLCSKNGVYWFLAQMTKESHDYDGDFEEEEIRLGETITPTGNRISLGLNSAEPENIVADFDYLYGDRSADSEDEGEFTGNENMPAAYRYHNTVMILVRKPLVIRKLPGSHHSTTSLLALFGLVRDDPHCSVDQRVDAMTTILSNSLDAVKRQDDRYSYGRMISNEGPAEYLKIFQIVSDYCNLCGLSSVVSRVLQSALADKSWAKSKELIALVARQVATETGDGKEDIWSRWLSIPLPPVPTYRYVNERRETFEAVRKIMPPASVGAFDQWKYNHLDELLRAVNSYSTDDAEPLLNLIPAIPPKAYLETVLSCLTKDAYQAGTSRLLYLLGTKTDGDVATRESIVKPVYQRLLQASLPSFKLSGDVFLKPSPQPRFYGQPRQVDTSKQEFLVVLDQCMKLGLKVEAQSLLSGGLPAIPAPGSTSWSNWRPFYSFIRELVNFLQNHHQSQLNSTAAPFITQILQASSSFLASSYPKQPRDWRRPHTRCQRCGCGPCQALKVFLMDPVQIVGRFSYAEKIRKHLEHNTDDRLDFQFGTERSRSPYTLVIQKMNYQYTRSLQQWKSEVNDMRAQLSRMRIRFMFDILGGDVLQVAGLDNALVAAGAAKDVGLKVTQSLQYMSASTQNRAPPTPIAGTKRKAGVVDLTED